MNPALGAMLRRLLALALLAAAATATGARPVLLRSATDDASAAVSSGASDALFCDSWMLSVETGNAGPWVSVPTRCLEAVHSYMEGDRYASDSDVVALDSIAFAAQALANAQEGDAKPAWVFDIDETLLCNEPYYAEDLSRYLGWQSSDASLVYLLYLQIRESISCICESISAIKLIMRIPGLLGLLVFN